VTGPNGCGVHDRRSLSDAGTRGLYVFLDTNFLLYLYRCGSAARDQIFSVLDAVSASLFMPAQVQQEFWRNREDVIRRVVNTNSLTGLRDAKNKAVVEIRAWHQRTMLVTEAQALEEEVEALFKKLLAQVSSDRGGSRINLKADFLARR
jgi:hypothetical protein